MDIVEELKKHVWRTNPKFDDGFLTKEEIIELTGRKRAAEQVAWLLENRILHYLSRRGKVSVTFWAVNHPEDKVEEPNFEKVA